MKKNEFKLAVQTLILGVMLGVLGSLFANILERYFVQYGFIYELVVAVLFFGFVIYTGRIFSKNN